jgi:phosphoglycolate phosphatase
LKYDLVIFDWDGTLVDSADLIVGCMQSAFGDVGLRVPVAEEVRNIIGLGLNEAIVELNGDTSTKRIQEVREAYSHHFLVNDSGELSVFSGVYDLLDQLNADSMKMAVATGKSRRGLDYGLSRFKRSELFDLTRCADETKSKPDPLMLIELLSESSVDLRRAVMVGDSIYDMEMAQTLGMDAIAVTYGVHCHDKLGRYKPVEIVGDVDELSAYLLG